MYVDPGAKLSFGDLFEAPWLFDVFVRADATAMTRLTVSGKVVWVPRAEATGKESEVIQVPATMEPDDVVLTAGTLRMGVVMTDDCEIATLAGDREEGWKPYGKILMAGVRALDDKVRADLELGIHTLPADPDRGFPGGLVDFNRLYEVQTKSLVQPDKDHEPHKVLSLDDNAKYGLGERFGGHLLRQGPIAGELGARKLSQLLTAGGDADTLRALREARDWGDEGPTEVCGALARALAEAWFIGRSFDDVDEVVERVLDNNADEARAGLAEARGVFARHLRKLAEEAIKAADGLELA
jgi:hypothetical protein